jgi:ABC-type protease/lipase transport system fused ATPase/permease subunit
MLLTDHRVLSSGSATTLLVLIIAAVLGLATLAAKNPARGRLLTR